MKIVDAKRKYPQGFYDTIKQIFESGELTNGQYVRAFENTFQSQLRVPHAVAVSSCTSGLILLIKALNLSGRKVIVPTFTFSATVHALLWNHCFPILVDCDYETFNISTSDVEEKLKEDNHHIAGIVATHIFGNPCDIDKLEELSERYNCKLIFDSAHALGSKYHHQNIADRGNGSVYSFSPTKLLTTMEGGMITLNSKSDAKRLKKLRNYGNEGNYDFWESGLNARMNEVSGLMGLDLLQKVREDYIDRRSGYAEYYKHGLCDLDIKFQKINETNISAYKDFAILLKSEKIRDHLRSELLMSDIETRKYFKPVHETIMFDSFNRHLYNSESIGRRILCLPIWNRMEQSTLDFIIKSIREVLSDESVNDL